jgi:hypothetical protein
VRERIRDIRFTPERSERIAQLEGILAEYKGQRLSARQAYYQFVARDLIANEERSYKLITKLIADARYAGIVDWNAIEDRGREPIQPSEFDDLASLVDAALRSYRRPRWRDQPRYVELWVEKQALAGVLEPVARRFHVTLMVNKGYSSASAMKESAERLIAASVYGSKPVEVLYLGDHDPSGEDMVRDVYERLSEFGVVDLEVTKLGLTMEQIRQFDPPPNPAKITDSRAAAYIAKYGEHSWELDALPPDELNRLVTEAIESRVDGARMNALIEQEKRDKSRLREAAAQLRSESGVA